MTCSCALAISAELVDWVALGGGNSGCCGNNLHTYGFHRAANEIPTSDYSRAHEAAAPYNMSWACAGDFSHNGDPGLRARHATILARLMANDPALSMICEFIGQPWAGKPIYYWARWDGVQTLQRYTGQGHDTWSHFSWWRSRANERAYLWSGAGPAPTPVTPAKYQPTPVSQGPKYPGYLMQYNPGRFDANVRTWQAQMRSRGWNITADGFFGNQSRAVLRQFQGEKGLGVDGVLGSQSWAATWTAVVT